ncbi:MAG: metallopeptidase TldD-related protein, partial [Pseudomonadota bacterium]
IGMLARRKFFMIMARRRSRVGMGCRRLLVLALIAQALLPAAFAADDPLVDLLDGELKRYMTSMAAGDPPAYFLSYRVADIQNQVVSASFGALERDSQQRWRRLYVEARVGDYELDNTHALRSDGQRWGVNYRNNWQALPLTDDPEPVRQLLWQATDRVYQQALDHMAKVTSNLTVKVAEEDRSADFSRQDPVVLLEPEAEDTFTAWLWQDRLRRYSARFAGSEDLLVGRVTLSHTRSTLRLVNSEGTRLRKSSGVFRVTLQVMVKADDGMELPLTRTLLAASEDDLPSDETMQATIDELLAQADALRTAPLVTAYSGPVLLEGRASAVFFHELLGHRVEGHRLRREEGAQTLKRKLGEQILPKGFNVYFDPTRTEFQGEALLGSYAVDDEGVPAQRVDVVRDGVLEGFLMSRIPIEGFPRSNGHGRAEALRGRSPVARQSNLFVEVDNPLSDEAIKARFVAAIGESGNEFGLIIRDAVGGFTTVNRQSPNALKVIPTILYKVYPDGREELARGVDVIGTPLLTLSHIQFGADNPEVFHGWCGAESGSVPVSLVAPSVMLDRLEVQRKARSQTRPPILPNPAPEDSP